MKLKALWWYLFNKNKYHTYNILCWIKRAKREYVKDVIKAQGNSFLPGMCFSLAKTAPKNIVHLIDYFNIHYYIPEYTPKYFNTKIIIYNKPGDTGYWWPREETKPRIEAFNKLIKVYENKLKRDNS